MSWGTSTMIRHQPEAVGKKRKKRSQPRDSGGSREIRRNKWGRNKPKQLKKGPD